MATPTNWKGTECVESKNLCILVAEKHSEWTKPNGMFSWIGKQLQEKAVLFQNVLIQRETGGVRYRNMCYNGCCHGPFVKAWHRLTRLEPTRCCFLRLTGFYAHITTKCNSSELPTKDIEEENLNITWLFFQWTHFLDLEANAAPSNSIFKMNCETKPISATENKLIERINAAKAANCWNDCILL